VVSVGWGTAATWSLNFVQRALACAAKSASEEPATGVAEAVVVDVVGAVVVVVGSGVVGVAVDTVVSDGFSAEAAPSVAVVSFFDDPQAPATARSAHRMTATVVRFMPQLLIARCRFAETGDGRASGSSVGRRRPELSVQRLA
jgi:hypothetical protein